MDSFFYSHAFYVDRRPKRKRMYKIVRDEKTGRMKKVEIIPKPKPEYIAKMRRLFPDFDDWDLDHQLSMMGEDDAE
jgi:hypothetical protein